MPLRVPARKQLSTPVSSLTHSLLLLALLLQRTCGQIQGSSLAGVSILSAAVTDAGPPLSVSLRIEGKAQNLFV